MYTKNKLSKMRKAELIDMIIDLERVNDNMVEELQRLDACGAPSPTAPKLPGGAIAPSRVNNLPSWLKSKGYEMESDGEKYTKYIKVYPDHDRAKAAGMWFQQQSVRPNCRYKLLLGVNKVTFVIFK